MNSKTIRTWPYSSKPIGKILLNEWADYFTQLETEMERLREIKDSAHQWSAGYPLGGGGDEVAARDIYQLCLIYDNAR